jgi:phosphohistidine phosphatase
VQIYLVRHGEAISPHAVDSDESRWLVAAGRQAVRRVGQQLREQGVAFDAVVTSPLVRAVQTAELLAAEVGFPGPIEALSALAPDGQPRRVGVELPARGVRVAAVGHEPTISALARIVGGRSVGQFVAGQVVCIEDGSPRWRLEPASLSITSL